MAETTRTPLTPETLRRIADAGLDPARLPAHIAIIMDGNGRWARQRGLPRVEGHRQGVQSVRGTVEECCRLGIGQLTLYCLSSENWKRPRAELDFLMALLKQYLLQERDKILRQNIRFSVIGRREGLPDEVLAEIDENIRLTKDNSGLTLCLAINYGARTEITDAVRAIARQVQEGRLSPDDITEQIISSHLYTAGIPDPDLLIRTAGEHRVSNYLLWQISYAELHTRLSGGVGLALLDVREQGEYNAAHIPGASWLPRRLIERRLARLVPCRTARIAVSSGGDGPVFFRRMARLAPTTASTLLKSWAMPPVIRPSASSFCACASRARTSRRCRAWRATSTSTIQRSATVTTDPTTAPVAARRQPASSGASASPTATTNGVPSTVR